MRRLDMEPAARVYCSMMQRPVLRYVDCDALMTALIRSTNGPQVILQLFCYLLKIQAVFKCMNRCNLRFMVWWICEHSRIGDVFFYNPARLIRFVGVRQLELFADTRLESALIDAVVTDPESMYDYPTEKQDRFLAKRLITLLQAGQVLDAQNSFKGYRALLKRIRERISLLEPKPLSPLPSAYVSVVLANGITKSVRPILDYLLQCFPCTKDFDQVNLILTDCDINAESGIVWNINDPYVSFHPNGSTGVINGFSLHMLYLFCKYGLQADIDAMLKQELVMTPTFEGITTTKQVTESADGDKAPIEILSEPVQVAAVVTRPEKMMLEVTVAK